MNRNTLLKSIITLVLLVLLPSMTTAATETITWIHTDHLGSPIAGRNAAGETTWEQAYAPWGERQAVAGVPQAPAGVGYTGHVYDEQVGLIYAGARWYDPAMGRFISPDAVRFLTTNPNSNNRYKYANYNPYIYIDPDGNAEIAASSQGLHVTLVTPNEKVQSQFYKLFKRPAPGWLKRLDRASSAGESAGKALTMGEAVGPKESADPRTVLRIDAILSKYLEDNTDILSGQAYSAEDIRRAFMAAAKENNGFEDDFLVTHPDIDSMIKKAQENYDGSFAGQSDRGIGRFINLGHGADDI